MGSPLSRLSVFRLGKTGRDGEDIPTRTVRIREGKGIKVYINIRYG